MDNETVFCTNCGTKNPLTAKFCTNCGADLSAAITAKKALLAKQAAQAQPTSATTPTQPAANQASQATSTQAPQPGAVPAPSAEELLEARYQDGLNKFTQGDLPGALQAFQAVPNYKDSAKKVTMIQELQKKQSAEAYEKAYQNALQTAQQAKTAYQLRAAMDYIIKFGNYKDAGSQLQNFQTRYDQMAAQEKVRRSAQNKQVKIIGIIVAVIAVVAIGVFVVFKMQQDQATKLQQAVQTQRVTNADSFNALPAGDRKNVRSMMKTYGGNVKDYTYSVKAKTDDYDIINYTFKSPDDKKDVLPKNGTRISSSVAIYRK